LFSWLSLGKDPFSLYRDEAIMPAPSRKLPFYFLMLFLCLMILGINLGEVPVVMEKAVSICLSCIGIE
jgi:hypothetical protein